MSDLQNLFLAEAHKEAARYEREAAGQRLKNATIEVRRCELMSQASNYWGEGRGLLTKSFGPLSERERKIARAVANYVVLGKTEVNR